MAAQLTDLLVAERTGIRGSISVADIVALAGPGGQLNVQTAPVYEYREIWGEENAALATGYSAEFSYGNGATGYIGIPFDAGWQLIQMYFNADTFNISTGWINIDVSCFLTASSTAAHVFATMAIDSNNIQGQTNNAWYIETLATPIAIPSGPIGFATRSSSGGITDARVGIRARREIGQYVTGVTVV